MKESTGRAYGGRSPEERAADRRARLLEAALDLYGTEGYSSVSIERLCSHAGVTARHFYEAFEGREAVLIGLIDSITEQVRQRVTAALSRPSEDPRRRALNGLNAFLEAYLKDRRVARVVSLECVGVSEAVEERRHELLREFAAVVEVEAANQARDLGREVHDFKLTSIAVAGATFELIAQTVHSKRPPSLARLRRELMLVYLALIQGYELARDDLADLGL